MRRTKLSNRARIVVETVSPDKDEIVARVGIERDTMTYNLSPPEDQRFAAHTAALLSDSLGHTRQETKEIFQMLGFLPSTGITRSNAGRRPASIIREATYSDWR